MSNVTFIYRGFYIIPDDEDIGYNIFKGDVYYASGISEQDCMNWIDNEYRIIAGYKNKDVPQ